MVWPIQGSGCQSLSEPGDSGSDSDRHGDSLQAGQAPSRTASHGVGNRNFGTRAFPRAAGLRRSGYSLSVTCLTYLTLSGGAG